MPELDFKGKEFVRNHHLTVPYRPLVPDASKSVGDPDLDGNLIIHGDNLEALKSLLPKYAGKVDCIFIDPPYNTGNEGWNYNDNVNSPVLKAWFSENPVGIDDGLRHDKWCCMMWPRLLLLNDLLGPNGYMAIAIDDNELPRLLQMLSDLPTTGSVLGVSCWLSDPSGGKQKTALRTGHEYILFYGSADTLLAKQEVTAAVLVLEDEKGPYAKGREVNKWGANSLRENRKTMFFPLPAPDGTDVWPIRNDGREGCWRLGERNKYIVAAKNKPEIFHWELRPFDPGVSVDGKDVRWVPYEKLRDSTRLFGWRTWLDKMGTNSDGTRELNEIFGTKVFDTPKPYNLVAWIVGLLPNDDGVVLDSFAGSGTTAHAVLGLNAVDDGNRKFILVECEEYADALTAERVRRVIRGYPYQGNQRETLYEKKLTWTEIKKGEALREDAEKARSFAEAEGSWDNVRITVDDGVLKVIGERNVKETAPGLGGSFTYCTLGAPLKLENLLNGDDLPGREALGAWLLYVAGTGDAVETTPKLPENVRPHFLARRGDVYYWFMYQPDREWLRSHASALTLDLARAIAAVEPKAEHRVFAPQKFVSNKLLRAEGLRIEFAPIPFALFRRGAE